MSENPNWLREVAERADAVLRAMPADDLGPAGRTLMGIKDVKCPTCHGSGTVRVDPRVPPSAAHGETDHA